MDQAWEFHLQKMGEYSHHREDYKPVIELARWAMQQKWATQLYAHTGHQYIWFSLPGRDQFDRPAFNVDNGGDGREPLVNGFRFQLRTRDEQILERRCSPEDGRAMFVTFVGFLHCLLGNHAGSIAADALWRTSTVLSLASAIHAQTVVDGLPILADALEDAGCTDRDILDHCRQAGEHARGCWVVDLVLGKE